MSTTTDSMTLPSTAYTPSRKESPRASERGTTTPNNASTKQRTSNSARRVSGSSTKRRFNPFGGRSKPGLAVDTSVSRHRGRAPLQVFPYESKTQEQGFVSLSDLKGLNFDGQRGLKDELQNRIPVRPSAQRSVTDTAQRPSFALRTRSLRRGLQASTLLRSKTAEVLPVNRHGEDLLTSLSPLNVTFSPASSQVQRSLAPPLHKRIKGLRPSPLDLDVSPSDRAIPIGIAIPSAALSQHTTSPQSTAPYPHSPPRTRNEQTATTPTILITPAREDFGVTFSPEDLDVDHGYRPASSVYSRYTNCAPKKIGHGSAPPVPPLPLFAAPAYHRESSVTAFEEEKDESHEPKSQTLSVCTVFEEQNAVAPALSAPSRDSRRLTTETGLPTPMRSNGWWNVITSPFSAKSHTKFLQSSQGDNSPDGPLLNDVADMGRIRTVDFLSGSHPTDDELRSAPPVPEVGRGNKQTLPSAPKRSHTAPGALDANVPDVNIYRVPSQGEAAAYYDSNRRFPSMIGQPAGPAERDVEEPFDPRESCYHEEASRGDPPGSFFSDDEDDDHTAEGPFSDNHEVTSDEGPSDHLAEAGLNDDAVDLEDEGQDTNSRSLQPCRPTNERSLTDASNQSEMSPLSATPIVGTAHIATMLGPRASGGEQQREVVIPATRTPSPPNSARNASIAASSRDEGITQSANENPFTEKKVYRPLHSRQDSHGLGISDSSAELFPKPIYVSEKRELRTDRYGQLTLEPPSPPGPPWYRRFFWLLVTIIAMLIALMVVLLVIFVPQNHGDMAVQSQWLNLTGYPPMPTGVATVVQPTLAEKQNGCVQSSDMWTCAAPSAASRDNTQEQPNFRLEIRFRNGTISNTSSIELANSTVSKRAGHAVSAGSIVKRNLLRARDAWTDAIFSPSPAPPSQSDQEYLGRTTDGISAPYDGEATPYYISLLNSSALESLSSHRMVKRQGFTYPYPTAPGTSNSSDATGNASTKASTAIPSPDTMGNVTPEPVLYPFAAAQPVRLYNRGQSDEHYGFYTYFDYSLIVNSSSSASNSSDNVQSTNTSLCTWSQTRFLVQIWTSRGTTNQLSSNVSSSIDAANSTANDMTHPGSFAYPVTITLDRHGGDAAEKGVYCYGLDASGKVEGDVKTWITEDRSFGGTLVNPAEIPASNDTTNVKRGNDGAGSGIDGGTGGCKCQWSTLS